MRARHRPGRPEAAARTRCTPAGMNWIQGGADATSSDVHCIASRIDWRRSGMNSIRRPINSTPSGIHCMRSGMNSTRKPMNSTRSGIHWLPSGIDSPRTLVICTPSRTHCTWTGIHSTWTAIHGLRSASVSRRREMKCTAGRSTGQLRGTERPGVRDEVLPGKFNLFDFPSKAELESEGAGPK